MFTEVFLNYNCMSLPHFRTGMNKIHLCVLRILCGEQMHNCKAIT